MKNKIKKMEVRMDLETWEKLDKLSYLLNISKNKLLVQSLIDNLDKHKKILTKGKNVIL